MTEHHTRTDYRYAPIPEALLFDANITATAVRLYGVLARHGMDPDSCYPSHRRIGELAGIAPRSVARPLRELEEAGWLARVPRSDERGQRISDGYALRSSAQENAWTPRQSADPPRASAQGLPAPARDERKQEERESMNEEGGRLLAFAQQSASQEVENLCEQLADAIEAHRAGEDRPAVTKRWLTDMRLLAERGPTDLAKPEAVGAQRIERAIRFVFRALATPGADGFCWADQVRSPAALRRHWTRLRDAARSMSRAEVADLLAPNPEDRAIDISEARAALRSCRQGLCDGSGWLEEEFDPFAEAPGEPRPCPSCRPRPAQAEGGAP